LDFSIFLRAGATELTFDLLLAGPHPVALPARLTHIMNGLSGSVAPPGQLYVRALYDYDADDRISLSFRANDIIQVITQLESGWWDGVIHGVRGWFPSNYCTVISPPYDEEVGSHIATGAAGSEADELEEEYHNRGANHAASGVGSRNGAPAIRTQEEAAFWIPQATPDGRLFYFNTLTGASTMELPLESPSSATETGPRDRTNVFIPDQTRPPADIMSGSHDRDDDTDYTSASEAEEIPFSTSSNVSFAMFVSCARSAITDILFRFSSALAGQISKTECRPPLQRTL
jgi:son of sevenless-like protein